MVKAIGSPGVTYDQQLDQVYAFVTGDDVQVHVNFFAQDKSNWKWESLWLPTFSPPGGSPSAVIQGGTYRADVVDNVGNLSSRLNYTDDWTDNGQPLGDAFGNSKPAIGSPSAICYVFVVSNTGFLNVFNSHLNEWNGPGPATSIFFNSPSAVYQSSIDRVCAFAVGSDNALYIYFYDQGNPAQGQLQSLGSPPGALATGSPGAVYQSSIDRVCAFVISANSDLYLAYYDHGQGRWLWEFQDSSLGLLEMSSPGAVYQSSIDRVCAFVVRGDGHLYLNYFDHSKGKWLWEDQGTPSTTLSATGSPGAVYQSSIDRVHAFVVGSDGHLYVNYFDRGQGKWRWQDNSTRPRSRLSCAPSALKRGGISTD